MPTLPPHLADLADELRAEFAAQGGHEKVLVEQLVAAALRLRLLHDDPRMFLPHTVDRTWDRDHDLASRNYHRAYRALRNHRSSAPARPRVSHTQAAGAPKPTPPRPSSPAPKPAPAAVPPPPSTGIEPRRAPEPRPAPNPSPAQAPAPRSEPGPPSPHTRHRRHDKHRPKRLFPRPSANQPPASSPRASPA